MSENDYVEAYRDKAGEYRWRLRAGNNETIADSGESYLDKSGLRRAIDRVNPDLEIRWVDE
jgi:uncharacterized protein YegP (UPF0339 family)